MAPESAIRRSLGSGSGYPLPRLIDGERPAEDRPGEEVKLEVLGIVGVLKELAEPLDRFLVIFGFRAGDQFLLTFPGGDRQSLSGFPVDERQGAMKPFARFGDGKHVVVPELESFLNPAFRGLDMSDAAKHDVPFRTRRSRWIAIDPIRLPGSAQASARWGD